MNPEKLPEESSGAEEARESDFEAAAPTEASPPPSAPLSAQRGAESEPRARPSQPDIRPVEFSQISDSTDEGEAGSLEMLMDIRLPVTVELGRTETLVRDILDYGPGTVVELDKLAGDPVDILVNGKLVAQGEVVVIDDHFGVRINVLLSPRERVQSLGGS